MSTVPQYPLLFPDDRDERFPGVVLIDGDQEYKRTAERKENGWYVLEWEVYTAADVLYWIPRHGFLADDALILALLKLTTGN